MTTALQITAMVALGLFVSWLAHVWFGLFESENLAFVLGFALLLTFGFIVDRRQAARRRQEAQDFRLSDER